MAENFDLDNFPTSRAARQMLSRVSPIYDKSYVGKWLFEVMGLEMDEARALVESLRAQCFLERCTWGMRYWEERYGIPVDETKDLEERRAAVLTKRGRKGQPISPAALEDILEALTGREITVRNTTRPTASSFPWAKEHRRRTTTRSSRKPTPSSRRTLRTASSLRGKER